MSFQRIFFFDDQTIHSKNKYPLLMIPRHCYNLRFLLSLTSPSLTSANSPLPQVVPTNAANERMNFLDCSNFAKIFIVILLNCGKIDWIKNALQTFLRR